MPRRMIYDPWLFFTASLLLIGGMFMVGSASNYIAMDYGKSPSAYYMRHSIHALLGLAGLLAVLAFPYRRLARRWVVRSLLGGCLLLLLLVLTMAPVGGARRWIPLGLFNLQPSEFAKIVAVIFMAWVLARKEERVNELLAVPLPTALVVGGLAFLVVIEPDLGSAVMITAAAAVMIFVAGLSWKALCATGVLGVLGLVASIVAEPYRLERVRAFLDPSADQLGASFQLNQSLLAIGSGGLLGAGFGQGHQKAFYIPAAHTDFIFAVVGEELGLIGTLTLLAAFLIVYWRGMRAALRAPDRFGFYLAFGLTHLIVLQGLINMAVCLGLLPTKGLPLPFISYGGSSLLASMIATGLLLNVSQHSN